MKPFIFTASAVLLVALAAPASATLSTGNLALDVQSAVGSDAHVSVTVEDGTATLTGFADNGLVRTAAVRAVLAHDDVYDVDNRIILN